MTADEKSLIQAIVKEVNDLPSEKQEFVLVYAEGVRAGYAAQPTQASA